MVGGGWKKPVVEDEGVGVGGSLCGGGMLVGYDVVG
jgi:hypothetical protein